MPTAETTPRIDLSVNGTSEARWAPLLDALPDFRWPSCDRLVVVSPHPDDETLGSGGLIATAAMRAVPVLVVSVTDGEAARPQPDLGAERRLELDRAVALLSPTRPVAVERLAIPDGDVASHEQALLRRLASVITPADLVVSTLLDDGHPDHEACGRAAATVAFQRGAAMRAAPVWAWHWHDPRNTSIATGTRLSLLPSARARKRRAVACYRSQLGGTHPVVPAFMLDRLDRAGEVFVAPAWSR
jgi:LmbE family N-acetylglucosaminyl deacetylase